MDSERKTIALQIILFLITIVTTTIAGAEWSYGYSVYKYFVEDGAVNMGINYDYTFSEFLAGLPFSLSFLFILTVHEFGHYFTARYYNIKTSLPYYIPLPPFTLFIGTLGALIRIRQRIPTTSQNFDVGIAGPLAGFVAALFILILGLMTLPAPEHIYLIHPEYKEFGLEYAKYVYQPEYLSKHGGMDMTLANNVIINFLASIFADPIRMPNYHEMMHYPLLFAGFLSLFFTALNMLPIGQFDGGHVVYGLFGKKIHRIIASVVFTSLVLVGGIGVVIPGIDSTWLIIKIPIYILFLYTVFTALRLDRNTTIIISLAAFLLQYLVSMFVLPNAQPSYAFLLLTFLMSRFVGVPHPGAEIEVPLTTGRKFLGWIALLILVLCFTPQPIAIG